jgi:DNA polymerase-4
VSVSHLREQPVIQLDLPFGLPAHKRRPGTWQGVARWSADRAIDKVRQRFGRDAVGHATSHFDRRRSVPDAFQELPEKDLGD